MAMKLTEAVFTIGLVGFILLHPSQFSDFVKSAGKAYGSFVKGMETLGGN